MTNTLSLGMALPLMAVAIFAPATAQTPGAKPGIVRVRLDTAGGPITLALDARRAPATTANFLKYVDDGRFDDTTFYRAARGKADPTRGFIQAGIRTDAKRILPSFPFESTTRTSMSVKPERRFDCIRTA